MVDVHKIVTAVILVIVAIIVIFQLVGSTASDLTNASANITASGLPLASLFAADGIVLLIFMAGILLIVVALSLKHMHKGK